MVRPPFLAISKYQLKDTSMLMPSELQSDVVIVQTNHGLVYAVPVPPQSFAEHCSNTLEPTTTVPVNRIAATEPVEAAVQSPQMVG